MIIGLQHGGAPSPDDVETIVMTLPRPQEVVDLRSHAALGRLARLEVRMAGGTPMLLAVSDTALPNLAQSGPHSVQAGESAMLQVGLARPSAAEAHVVYVEVNDPAGRLVPLYSGNLLLRPGLSAAWTIPLAANAAPGQWTVHVADGLTGDAATWLITVASRR